MKPDNGEKPFLATTALEEFWDTSKPLLFLGEWCKRYSRRAFWENLQGLVVKGQWDNPEAFNNAYCYVNEVYEKILQMLAQALNNIHGVNYSNRYWRILLGPWLLHYIHILYDRYFSIRVVLDNYPEFTTYGLADEDFIVPNDTIDFLHYAVDDLYNLQIYTKILDTLGINFPRKNWQIVDKRTDSDSPKHNAIRLLLHQITRLFSNNKIILKDPYFDRHTEFKIIICSLGKVWTHVQPMIDVPSSPVDFPNRLFLRQYLLDDDEFMGVLKSTLPMDMPQCYVEAYNKVSDGMLKNYPTSPKAIVSAVSWYFNEHFKQWAALSSENGTKLMGVQHGGNYAGPVPLLGENHELTITDRFYSWGWERSDCISEVVAMPATKLSARKSYGAFSNKKGILLVATATPRYLIRYMYFNNYRFADYLQWQLKFIDAILPEKRKEMRVRPHQNEYGWDMRQRWKDVFPDLCIESYQVPFLQSLENCRLYVCDHLSTTFVEALSANKPTILFWDPLFNELREEAKPYYEALHSVGIIHYLPVDAAKAVNIVYDDIESWWNDPDRQDAVHFFCNRFAKTSAAPVKEWVSEFKRTFYDLEKRQ